MGFYKFSRYFCLFFFRLYFKIKVKGVENVESVNSGIVLISNHQSYLDPVFLGLFLKRRLFFMAKKELFCVPVLKGLILKLGAFPIERGKNDTKAFKTAEQIVKKGKILAMFPQGHRSKNINSLKPKTGFLRIALNSDAKVVPCSLFYRGYFPRSRVLINFLEPIDLKEFAKKENVDFKNIKFKEAKRLTFKVWQNILNSHKKQQQIYFKKISG